MPLDKLYIVANFKETQLARLVPGEKVRIVGRRHRRSSAVRGHGLLAGVRPPAAVFSLLPPENATGNFTKVVQRVPVRIDVSGGCAEDRQAARRPVASSSTSTAAPRPPRSRRQLRRSSGGFNAMATATDSWIGARPARRSNTMDPRRVIAFLAMVFGMFMAILDIQIVSASLAEIQAGLSASSDEIRGCRPPI